MIPLPVYAPNLPERTDRKEALLRQFAHREEFCLSVVPAIACREYPAWGLWQTFTGIVEKEKNSESPFFIFCEDDHTFTKDYSFPYLQESIAKADALQADVLSGGVSWLTDALQCDDRLFWLDRFNGMQFTVVFRRFYDYILRERHTGGVVADYRLSELSDRIFVMYPFISVQKEFGYSDVTMKNNRAGYVSGLFRKSSEVLGLLDKVRNHYQHPEA